MNARHPKGASHLLSVKNIFYKIDLRFCDLRVTTYNHNESIWLILYFDQITLQKH